ncbi:hypothetical protein [uncultured Aquimarina sp.]|uniref:hypothetical protein n=1 Tax=uncultured Aquimarina sp. TaxID=575652 RepID=UPI0026384B92|nr:hypothetical protein [uncultured Aquimarina sp.]
MRDLNPKKNQPEKVKVISLHHNKKAASPTILNLIIIALLFSTFMALSIKSDHLFLTEILLSGSIIALLGISNSIPKTKR